MSRATTAPVRARQAARRRGRPRLRSVTAGQARWPLVCPIQQVTDDRVPVEMTSNRGSAVLMSRENYSLLQETAHLLRVPANARRLIESLT